ncbi:hypothetical protein J3F83DRAFT_719489 [Trichoderma novae-zelandiae]
MAHTGNLGCTVMAKPQNDDKSKKFTGNLGCTVMAKPAADDKSKKFTGNLGCTVIWMRPSSALDRTNL